MKTANNSSNISHMIFAGILLGKNMQHIKHSIWAEIISDFSIKNYVLNL